jgi:cytochrome b561
MLLKNTENRFGLVAILLHWIMAILLIGLLAMGLYMVSLPIGLEKLKLYGWHKEYGFLVLALVIFRLTWRLINLTPTLSSLSWPEKIAARLVHWAFYAFMFALPISGWLMTSAAGLPASFFGLFTLPNLTAPDPVSFELFRQAHKWLGYGLILTLFLHICGALKHHFIDKDNILRRMIS